jgi:hypothetical protein
MQIIIVGTMHEQIYDEYLVIEIQQKKLIIIQQMEKIIYGENCIFGLIYQLSVKIQHDEIFQIQQYLQQIVLVQHDGMCQVIKNLKT